MLFIFDDRKYRGETAVGIVCELKEATPEFQSKSDSVRDFLVWSLDRLADRIPPRELDVSPDLDDEIICFNYLCLLDSCEIGTLCQ